MQLFFQIVANHKIILLGSTYHDEMMRNWIYASMVSLRIILVTYFRRRSGNISTKTHINMKQQNFCVHPAVNGTYADRKPDGASMRLRQEYDILRVYGREYWVHASNWAFEYFSGPPIATLKSSRSHGRAEKTHRLSIARVVPLRISDKRNISSHSWW